MTINVDLMTVLIFLTNTTHAGILGLVGDGGQRGEGRRWDIIKYPKSTLYAVPNGHSG